MAEQFMPVLITLGVAIVTALAMLGLAAFLGQRSRVKEPFKGETYESGIPLMDHAIKRIPVKFYLVALAFVVLDVEVAFLYPWAVTYRELLAEGAVVVLVDMLVFILLLAFAYAYLWGKGIFDWGPRRRVAPPLERGGEG